MLQENTSTKEEEHESSVKTIPLTAKIKKFRNISVQFLKHLFYISHLILFSYIGTIVRFYLIELYNKSLISENMLSDINNLLKLTNETIIILNHLNEHNVLNKNIKNNNVVFTMNDLLFPELYANIVGCFIMGFIFPFHLHFIQKPLQKLNELKSDSFKLKKTEERPSVIKSVLYRVYHSNVSFEKRIYTGIATGLCGSITTFSSWQFQAITSLLKLEILSFFSKEIVGFTTSYFAFYFAKDLSTVLQYSFTKLFHLFKNLFTKNLVEESEAHFETEHGVSLENLHELSELAEKPTSPIKSVFERKSTLTVPSLSVEVTSLNDLVEQIPEEEEGKLKELETLMKKEIPNLENTETKLITKNFIIKLMVEFFLFISCLIFTIILFTQFIISCKEYINNQTVTTFFSLEFCILLLFSPIGTILRYLVCKLNVKTNVVKKIHFPLFTMAVNLFGTILIFIFNGLVFKNNYLDDTYPLRLNNWILWMFYNSF
ncbi:hypothetical protein ABK040_012859 [Willaertia magna]